LEAAAALETRREGREGHDVAEDGDMEEKECDRVAAPVEEVAGCVLEAERMRADSAWRWEMAVATDIEGMRGGERVRERMREREGSAL